jgi:hypothetical protein
VDAVQGGHVDDEAAAVLGVVAVGAAEAARDHAAVLTVGGLGHRLDDHLGIGGRQHLGHAGRGASPAGQPLLCRRE